MTQKVQLYLHKVDFYNMYVNAGELCALVLHDHYKYYYTYRYTRVTQI